MRPGNQPSRFWHGFGRTEESKAMANPSPMHSDPSSSDLDAEEQEMVRGLQKKDKAFLFRLVLRVSVAALLGFWIFLQLTSGSIGGCVADGFGNVTGE